MVDFARPKRSHSQLILNLGCGTKISDAPEVINIDWSPYLRIALTPVLKRVAPLLLDQRRAGRFAALPSNIRVHNLATGIPYPTDSVDVVYHSHLLEHLDRNKAVGFQREIFRVLRPGGIQRIVVPDLERLCRQIVNDDGNASHDEAVAALIEQCVRREAYGTSKQAPLRRRIENIVLGDARKRGETHQWMYDSMNLRELLEACAFTRIRRVDYQISRIPNWPSYLLDVDQDGKEYKPGSLYMEAECPE